MRVGGEVIAGGHDFPSDRMASALAPSVADAIRRIAAGGVAVDREVVTALRDSNAANARLSGLSSRERELLTLMAEGCSNRGLERLLGLSAKTVESHIHNVFTKLGLQAVEDDQHRVLAVLAHLRARDASAREVAARQ